jgi:hypothetical protein
VCFAVTVMAAGVLIEDEKRFARVQLIAAR